jgi:hypothetical protein
MAAVQGFEIVIDQGFVQREVERIVESKFFQELVKQRATMKPSRFCGGVVRDREKGNRTCPIH